MKIIIDKRETKLIDELSKTSSDKFECKVLDVGDIHICDDNDNIMLIFERKTIADLLSSIKDGRYSEQSLRLTSHELHNHYVYYFIEGPITKFQDEKLVYSSLCSLSYFKGFSLLRSHSVKETGDIITSFCKKLEKEITKGKNGYYLDCSSTGLDEADYCSSIKTSKKENITPENILQIMLMQIPKINAKSSSAIADKYNTMSDLLKVINDNKNELYDVKMFNDKTKKSRKINKSAIDNICKYLVN